MAAASLVDSQLSFTTTIINLLKVKIQLEIKSSLSSKMNSEGDWQGRQHGPFYSELRGQMVEEGRGRTIEVLRIFISLIKIVSKYKSD